MKIVMSYEELRFYAVHGLGVSKDSPARIDLIKWAKMKKFADCLSNTIIV